MAYEIARLRAEHHVASFHNSLEKEIENYLCERALEEQSAGTNSTHILFESSDPLKPIGYYTLSPISFRLENLPVGIGITSAYPSVGAYLLGRMGIDDTYRGQGLGTTLILDAYARCVRIGTDAGGLGLLVGPKNDALVEYYSKHGFTKLQKISGRRMFVPTATMKQFLQSASELAGGIQTKNLQ